MNNTTLHGRVQYLKQKITQLLARYSEQQETIRQLRAQNKQLTQQIANKVAVTHDFLNSPAMRKIAKQAIDQPSDWEARLDGYINDIDKSIAYIERMQ